MQRDLERIRRETDRHFNRLARTGLTAIAVGATAAVAGITVAINRARQDIDNLAKDAIRIGTTVDQLQALRLAAEEAGAGAETITTAIVKMQDAISDAAADLTESKGLVQSFEDLGIQAQDLFDLDPAEQFLRIAEAIGQVRNEADRVRITRDIFGRGGVAIAPLLTDDVRARVGNVSQFIQGANAAVTPQGAIDVQQMNDTLGRLSYAFGGLATQLTEEVSPAVTKVLNEMIDAVGKFNARELFGNLKDEIERIAPNIGELLEKFGEGLKRLDLDNLVNAVMSVLQGFIDVMTDPLLIEGLVFFGDFILRLATFLSRFLGSIVKALHLGVQFLIDTFQGSIDFFNLTITGKQYRERLEVSFRETAEVFEELTESLKRSWEAYGKVPELPVAFGGQMIVKRLAKKFPSSKMKQSKNSMQSLDDEITGSVDKQDELLEKWEDITGQKNILSPLSDSVRKKLDADIKSNNKALAEFRNLREIEEERYNELADRFRHFARLGGAAAGAALEPIAERMHGVIEQIARSKEIEKQFEGQIKLLNAQKDAAIKQAAAPPTEESTPQIDPEAYLAQFDKITEEADKLIESVATRFASRTESYATTLGEQFQQARGEVEDLYNRMVSIEGIDPDYTKKLNDAIKQIDNSEIENLNLYLEQQLAALDPLTDQWATLRNELDLIKKDDIYSAVEGNVERLENFMKLVDLGFYDIANSIQNSIGGAVEQVIRDGELDFRDFFAAMLQDIAAIQARIALFGQDGRSGIIGSVISSIAGAAIGGGGGAVGGGEAAATAAGSSSNFQALAGGGEFFPHRPMMVGERGPELLLPDTGGLVVPNHALQSMGRQHVVVNQTFTQGVDQQGLAYSLERMKQETMQAVFDAIQDGGYARDVIKDV